ncbi:hypothetical protein B0H19DRAFT_1271155 [Mycena capillaripes]|nr:hypothetical protein B0H19DRAFT_1271155 [Mycena capillaripes]
MQSPTAVPGTYRLNSDVNFAHNATTQEDLNRFVGKQDDWGREYAAAHEKMCLLNSLCSSQILEWCQDHATSPVPCQRPPFPG